MKKYHLILPVALFSWILPAAPAFAQEDAPTIGALAQMPVKEITVFKDGNAFVLHQGEMVPDADGNVLMDYLPSPVLGTFWPFVAEDDVTLSSVTAGQRRVAVARTALSIQELIEANPGASVQITETPASSTQPPVSYPATIIGLTERSSKELEATAPPNSGDLLPQKGNVLLLKTAEGTKAVKLEKIQDVTFKDAPKDKSNNVEFRNLLKLRLDLTKYKPHTEKAAKPGLKVGLMYLQRGVRWIPEYKITLDGKGNAVVKLQATLLNELTDMQDVTCNLVVGVPTFQFKDARDPMALQQNLARLSEYFQPGGGAITSNSLSNAIMTQTARMGEDSRRDGRADLGPEVAGMDQVQDLHIYTIKHVTIRKGERMVVPVSEFTVPYRDIYVLDLPSAPPVDVWKRFDGGKQKELALLLAAPKVMHKIRLINKGDSPFTTAPALIVSNKQVLAQGMMTYTSKGGSTDLDVTTAVDIQVKKTDNETGRTQNAVKWDGDNYMRVDLAGSVTLTNYRSEAVDLEITRHVLGNVTEAGDDGKIQTVNVLEDSSYLPAGGDGRPSWGRWWNTPDWWSHFNSIGRITWNRNLEAGKSIELKYVWHYFWR